MIRVESMEKRATAPYRCFLTNCIREIDDALRNAEVPGSLCYVSYNARCRAINDINSFVQRIIEQLMANGKSGAYRFAVAECEQPDHVYFTIAFQAFNTENATTSKLWFSGSSVANDALLDNICEQLYRNGWHDTAPSGQKA